MSKIRQNFNHLHIIQPMTSHSTDLLSCDWLKEVYVVTPSYTCTPGLGLFTLIWFLKKISHPKNCPILCWLADLKCTLCLSQFVNKILEKRDHTLKSFCHTLASSPNASSSMWNSWSHFNCAMLNIYIAHENGTYFANPIVYKCVYVDGGGAPRAKFAEKVHKPPLWVIVIKLIELNGLDASIWVPWSPSDPKKLWCTALIEVFKFIRYV